MKRALVLGGHGMLGRSVTELWRRRGQAVLALDLPVARLEDLPGLISWADAFHPQLVINCAAFTQVDACEEQRDVAMAVNGELVSNVVAVAKHANADLVHISTDYVFDGDGITEDGDESPRPYRETDPTGPQSAYGETKLRGEQEALKYDRAQVVRTSWLFGPHGPNFVATMQRLGAAGKPLKVVDDQVGCPTYTPFLARGIWDLQGTDLRGVIHYCNRDAVSWYGFAREILGPGVEVTPCTTDEFPRPARRPAWSVLDVSRFESAVGRRVEPWLHGLSAYQTSEE